MSDFAIRVENVTKCYQIYSAPRDRLKQYLLPRIQRALGIKERKYYREFWAVKSATFEVGRGQTVGIIGKNGSGKSTLLQMICGTLSPTSGSIETNGRIAALLELGSGFNPEFSGRENVYLNAAILGLSREETDERYESILEFADIGAFIDQPVKTYSSGMFVRLAFAVVAHVDPEILIIDEALSVGDAFFQSKCATAIRRLIDRGTTLLFVSHDTSSVKALCDKAILVQDGEIVAAGDSSEIVELYYSQRVATDSAPAQTIARDYSELAAVSKQEMETFATKAAFQRIQNNKIRFLNVKLLGANGEQTTHVEFKERVTLQMVLEAEADIPTLGFAYHIRDMKGVELVYSDSAVEGGIHLRDVRAGDRYVIEWQFCVSLQHGEYNFCTMASIPIDLDIGTVEVCDFIPYALQFTVSRRRSEQIYAAVHWPNEVSVTKV